LQTITITFYFVQKWKNFTIWLILTVPHTLIGWFTKSNEQSMNDVSCASLRRLAREQLISFILMSCSFQSYFILISEQFYIAANSEPAVSHLQLNISNFSHIPRIRASVKLLLDKNLQHLAGYKGVADCCSSFYMFLQLNTCNTLVLCVCEGCGLNFILNYWGSNTDSMF
jgi:hypothetical protein